MYTRYVYSPGGERNIGRFILDVQHLMQIFLELCPRIYRSYFADFDLILSFIEGNYPESVSIQLLTIILFLKCPSLTIIIRVT